MAELKSPEEIIDFKKQVIRTMLQCIRKDCEILIKRTYDFEDDLIGINTEEETREFDRTHDLEDGLMYIRLFG